MSSKVQEQTKTTTKEKKRVKITPPRNFRVVLHNNDVTPFESVIDVVSEVFCNGSRMAATAIMWQAHSSGFAQCLVAPKSVCDEKVKEANDCKMRYNNEDPRGLYNLLVFETQPMPTEE